MTRAYAPASVITPLLTFYCPFPAVSRPADEHLRERTLAWVQRFDLGEGDDQLAMKHTLTGEVMVENLFPHAAGELAQALADYNAWAFAANDYSGADHSLSDLVATMGRWERLFRSPDSWPQENRGLDLALAEVLGRLRSLMTPVQFQRFSLTNGAWCYHMAWEVCHRERDTALSVNDYLAIRIGAVGVYAASGYLDAVQGVELSAQQWAHPTVQAAIEAGLFSASLDNDRYSYLYEQPLPIHKKNLIDAVRHDHPEATLEQAVTTAIAIRDRCLTCYQRLRQQLLADADDNLRRYLTGVDNLISGNITFGLTAVRYRCPGHPGTGTRTDTPSNTSTAPLPYPTIAWWWNQLP